MAERKRVKKDAWVEIHRQLLKPGERAPGVPEDTQGVGLELRARGFLQQEAGIGEEVTVRTRIGRLLSGRLVRVNPGYDHSFGPPIPELLAVGEEVRRLLEEDEPEGSGKDSEGGRKS